MQGERLRFALTNKKAATHIVNSLDMWLVERAVKCLDHPDLDITCPVEAYLFRYVKIPVPMREKYNLETDSILFFGVTKEGEVVSKWMPFDALDANKNYPNKRLERRVDKNGSHPFLENKN